MPTTGFGPLAVIVYPFCVVALTVTGVVIGGTTGVIAGGTTGLPWKPSGEVNAILEDLQRERDFTKEFRDAVKAAVPGGRQVSEDRAEAIVTARLDDLDLRQHLRQRMSLRMRALMMQEWARASEDPKSKTCEYEYTSPTMDVEDWLLRDGELFGDTFTEGIDTFARWMGRDLKAFSTRRAQPKTEDAPETCFQVRE
jgi:hypothetical protein